MEIIDYANCQNLEFNILVFFRDICKRNNLTYYLTYGTLIGAVRHGGFIPWDDDIDVFMPRQDYIKLVKIMKNMQGRYKLVSYEMDRTFPATLPKIIDTYTLLYQDYGYKEYSDLGLYIDIFILDGVGNTIDEARKQYSKSYEAFRHWSRASTKAFITGRNKVKTLLQWIKNIPFKLHGTQYYIEEHSSINQELQFENSKFVSDMTIGMNCGDDYIWPKEIFDGVMMKEFNGEMFAVPVGYDYLLSKVYGDYMTPPPLEKQVSHHHYKAYWRANHSEGERQQ